MAAPSRSDSVAGLRNPETGALQAKVVVYLFVAGFALLVAYFVADSLAVRTSEDEAVASLRKLNSQLIVYVQFIGSLHGGAVGFPSSLRELGPKAARLIDAELEAGDKGGYLFTYTPGEPLKDRYAHIVATYTIVAKPKNPSSRGRNFFTDQTGIIRQELRGIDPTASSPPY